MNRKRTCRAIKLCDTLRLVCFFPPASNKRPVLKLVCPSCECCDVSYFSLASQSTDILNSQPSYACASATYLALGVIAKVSVTVTKTMHRWMLLLLIQHVFYSVLEWWLYCLFLNQSIEGFVNRCAQDLLLPSLLTFGSYVCPESMLLIYVGTNNRVGLHKEAAGQPRTLRQCSASVQTLCWCCESSLYSC